MPASLAAEVPLPEFSVERFERVQFGSKRATFWVRLAHVELSADLFAPEGKEPFVAPGSVRSRYSGVFERTSRFSPDLSAALLEVALDLYNGAR